MLSSLPTTFLSEHEIKDDKMIENRKGTRKNSYTMFVVRLVFDSNSSFNIVLKGILTSVRSRIRYEMGLRRMRKIAEMSDFIVYEKITIYYEHLADNDGMIRSQDNRKITCQHFLILLVQLPYVFLYTLIDIIFIFIFDKSLKHFD